MRIVKFFVLILFLVGCVASCKEKSDNKTTDESNPTVDGKKPLRFGMVTGVKPEKVDYYKELHADTWDGVLKKIHECNIRNYSIYLQKIDDKLFLFSYYEYVGDNYEEDMRKIAADSVTQRWWKETDPCQIPLPEAAAQQKIWTSMEEVFHAD